MHLKPVTQLTITVLIISLVSGLALARVRPPVDTLMVGNGTEPETLSPYQIESLSSYNIAKNLFEGLVYIGHKGHFKPAQAESWIVSPDGKTLTFKLRKGLQWSNGDKLTAKDFVYAMRYAVTPEHAQYRGRTLASAQVENANDIISGKKPPSTLGAVAPDDYTLIIKLEKPIPYALHILSRDIFPLHKDSQQFPQT